MTGEFKALGNERRVIQEVFGKDARKQVWGNNVTTLASIFNSNDALGTRSRLSPLWNQAIKNAHGGGLAREMVRIAALDSGLMAWHKEVSRPMNSLTIPITSHLTGATQIVNNSLRELMKSQQIFGDVSRYPFGKVNAFQAMGDTSMLKLARSSTFRGLVTQVSPTIQVEKPIKQYLERHPFDEIVAEAKELGVTELSADEQAAAAQILEERPEVAQLVKRSKGYAALTPGQRVFVLTVISSAVWLVVAFGVLYVQTGFPWTQALLDDLGITPKDAAAGSRNAVLGTGALNELAQRHQTKPVADDAPDN